MAKRGSTHNDITGDKIKSRVSNKNYRDNFDNIVFGQRSDGKGLLLNNGDGLASTQVKAVRNS